MIVSFNLTKKRLSSKTQSQTDDKGVGEQSLALF
jgi:hypothetical protein